MKYMRFCFIGLLLINYQNANAACEAEKDKWQSFVTACERAQAASGAMGIGCAIFMGPLGGLFSIPMAIEAATQDHLATIAKANYDKCMEQAAQDAMNEVIRQAIFNAPRDEEFYLMATSHHQAWSRNDVERWRRVELLEKQAKAASKKLITNLEAEGVDLSNPDVIAHIQAEVARINTKLDTYVREVHDINNQNLIALEKGHVKKCDCKNESCYGFYLGGYWEYDQVKYPNRKIK